MPLLVGGTGLIAATYGLVRLAYGLYLPDVQRDLGLEVGTAGVVSGASSLVYCVAALVGFLSAQTRTRSLVGAAALTAGVGAAGMAASGTAGAFAAFAILGSAGAGLASPALVAVLQRNVPAARQPGAQTTVNAGTGPGLVAAGLLALFLLPDWRAAWFVAGVVTVLAAGLVLLADRGPAARPTGREPLPPRSWFAAHRRPLTAALLLGAGSAAVWNFGRTYLIGAGLPTTVSVLAWVALGLGGVAVMVTAGTMARLPTGVCWLVTAGTMATTSALITVAPSTAWPALTASFAFGWGYTAATGVLIRWTQDIDPDRAPAGTALLFVTLILGQALGAWIIGSLLSWTFPSVGFLVAAGLSVAAALPAVHAGASCAIRPERPRSI